MKLLSRLVVVLTLTATTVAAQTKVTPPKNKYTPEQDVQIGREAAQEVRREYPLITDDQVEGYLERLGDRLVEAAPRELNHPAFDYSFTPVNLKDINAFALPGGPMFVNRGMIEAARTEGEVAGVMAHELAHVLLRHGTANASKQQGAQIGAIAGAIAGAIIGGGWGQVIQQGSQFGLGTWLMKYSRDYERQADIVGAQIMARAGYDPRDLAHMFETIQKQGGRGGPEWLSSHPNPGNRTQYITQEASKLQIAARPNMQGFQQAKSRLASMPPARSMAELERSGNRGGNTGGGSTASVGRIGEAVPAPSRQYRTVQGGQLFTVSVPSNWQALSSNNSIKYVPMNAYGDYRGQQTLTHGAELGVARASSRDLQEATQTLINGFIQSNDGMRIAGRQEYGRLSGRQAIVTPLEGRSALGGVERVDVYTTMLSNGDMFYLLTVVPEREAGTYSQAFGRVVQTVRINDR
jgi:Zn-dependent protease with chaperone function